MRPKIATFELKKHVIIKYEDLVYPSPASRCSSVAPAVRKALAQPKVQTCRGGQNAVGVQEFLVVILYIYIYTYTLCVCIYYIYTHVKYQTYHGKTLRFAGTRNERPGKPR